MSNPSENVRTDPTKHLVEKLKDEYKIWKRIDFKSVLHADELGKISRDIGRAIDRFKSELFFIVVFGPLKAGKSTLTNALAGEYVSPTGFGKETTRRPSLVMRAMSGDESCIEQYFSKDPNIIWALHQGSGQEDDKESVKNKREAFELVADYLRGFRTKAELDEKIEIKPSPLDPIRLEEALTADLKPGPLLTVIRCKSGDLLREGVVIVDMPGLDGSKSNWRNDPIHKWVIDQTEFVLFCQSSIAAINIETSDFVKEVIGQSTGPPIYLIQNIFDARHWRSKEEKSKDITEQRKEGKKRIEEILREVNRNAGLNIGVTDDVGLNLGLAWDGKHLKDEAANEWLIESEFPDFEKKLVKVLEDQRPFIQERNHLENLRQRINEAKKQLDSISSEIKLFHEENKKKRDNLDEARRKIDEVDYRNYSIGQDIQKAISNIAMVTKKAEDNVATYYEPWVRELKEKINELKIRFEGKIKGKDVNGKIKYEAERLGKSGNENHYAMSSILPKYERLAEAYCDKAEKEAMKYCNELLGDQKLSDMPTAISPTAEDLPNVLDTPLNVEGIGVPEKQFFIFTKKNEGTVNWQCIDHAFKIWEMEIQKRVDLWVEGLQRKHFESYCKKRQSHFREHLIGLRDSFDAKVKQKEEEARAAELIIYQMRKSMIDLESPLENAIKSK